MKYNISSSLCMVAVLGVVFCCITSQAATVSFTLEGNVGSGLLPGNENHVVSGSASGGLGSGGISFDTVTKVLSIDVEWGGANGFTNLTNTATAMHIHLATADPAPAGFSQDAPPIIDLHPLTGYNASKNKGGFLGSTPALSGSQEAALLGNQSYINVHTAANTGGEIRGHLVLIPEPGTLALLAFSMFMVGVFRCRLC